MFVCNARRVIELRRAATALLAAGTIVGCGGGDQADDATRATGSLVAPSTTLPTIELPAGVEVFVEFPRYLHLQRRLEVAFDNQSDQEILVEAVGVRSPLFEPVALEEPSSDVEVGRRRDLQVGLGVAVCPPPDGPTQVEVVAQIGAVRRHGVVEVPVEPLARISATECGRKLVLEHVEVGYADEHTVRDGVLETGLTLRRLQGDEPIAVTNVRGSVLIELAAQTASTPVAVMAPDADTLDVPVRLRVIRCDPHAVIESKKTFQLATWIAVGDREAQHLVVSPEGELRAALQTLIDDCLRAES